MLDNLAKFTMNITGLSTQQKVAEWVRVKKIDPFNIEPKNY